VKRLLLFRGGKIKTSLRRKTFLTPLPRLRPIQDTKDTHPTTRTPPDQETTTAGMGNTASTANCKITLETVQRPPRQSLLAKSVFNGKQ